MKKILFWTIGLLGLVNISYAVVPQGDCDGSGDVNIQDVLCTINIVLSGSSLGDADCDGSGNVNIQDVLCTINIVFNDSLSNSSKVPILTYHSWTRAGCTEETSNALGLAADLEVLHQNGYTIVPVYWISQWALGDRDGSTLPSKPVGITFDDGDNLDWVDSVSEDCPANALSFKTILENFKATHPNLPAYSPHTSSFVIASPIARDIIGGNTMSESWWHEAQSSSIMEIYNHSTDHDHNTIQGPITDPALSSLPSLFPDGVKIAASGYHSNNWIGQQNFQNVGNYNAAAAEIVAAANYIESKIRRIPRLICLPLRKSNTISC
jgi:hypothetical protein